MKPEITINIEQTRQNGILVCALSGWLDPNTSPELEKAIDLEGVNELIFDLKDVEYIFSSGLRVFLYFEKMMKAKGGIIKLVNVSDFNKSIFDLVGFQNIVDNA